MTRGLIVLVTAAAMGAAILPAPAQAGGNGGAVAAGVIGGLAVGSHARRRGRAAALLRRRRRFTSLRRRRPATGPAASRCGTAIAAPGSARACRSATNRSAASRRSDEFEAPARLARAFLFGRERCCAPRHSPYSPREF